MEQQQQRPIDVKGSEIVSTALLQLINTFPALDDKKIAFSSLDDKTGIGFFPTSGAAIISRRDSITGHVNLKCAYPFNIVYRASAKTEAQRLSIKEFLDTLGKWLERQPVVIHGQKEQLRSYPALDDGRMVVTSIVRSNPAYLSAAYQDGVEDWLISITLQYTYEYDT